MKRKVRHTKIKKTLTDTFEKDLKGKNLGKGITQEKLAELCDCSSQTISGTETGYSFPSSKILFKIAENLDIPMMYLFNFGEDTEISNKAEDLLIHKCLSEMSVAKKKIVIKIIQAINEVI